ncbi:MAG TPA: hypothetical protein VEI01_08735 [Terriglobales bacterium]|nr:hypothetical protein [Terriglobales bacterium]
MAFEKALIRVENEREFGELRQAIERVLAPGSVAGFLKRLAGKGVRIRDFDAVLDSRAIEQAGGLLQQSGISAKGLCDALTLSDRSQMREFYLLRIEEISPALRHRFHKLFQYY